MDRPVVIVFRSSGQVVAKHLFRHGLQGWNAPGESDRRIDDLNVCGLEKCGEAHGRLATGHLDSSVLCERKAEISPVVLVVDDETDSADLLTVILEMRLPAAVIHTPYGGQHALEIARQHRPTAAVLGLEMPDLNGEHLAHALTAMFPDATPMLIALSGNVGRLATIRQHGAFDHFMTKPVDTGTLARLLADIGPS